MNNTPKTVGNFFWVIIFLSFNLSTGICFSKTKTEKQLTDYEDLNKIVDNALQNNGKLINVEAVYFDGFETTSLIAQNIFDHENGYFVLQPPKVRAKWRSNLPTKALKQYATKIPGPGGGVRYVRVQIQGIFIKGGVLSILNEYPYKIEICNISMLDNKTGEYIKIMLDQPTECQ